MRHVGRHVGAEQWENWARVQSEGGSIRTADPIHGPAREDRGVGVELLWVQMRAGGLEPTRTRSTITVGAVDRRGATCSINDAGTRATNVA